MKSARPLESPHDQLRHPHIMVWGMMIRLLAPRVSSVVSPFLLGNTATSLIARGLSCLSR